MARNTSGLKRGNPATQFKKGEKQREIARLAGIKSGEARRRRKKVDEIIMQVANTKVPFDAAVKTMKQHGIQEGDADYLTAIILRSAMDAGLKGKADQAQFFIERYDEAVERAEELNQRRFSIPSELLGRDFIDINREIKPNYTYIFKGGRGSLKSTYISQKLIELLINNPKMHACCIRRVGRTLKDSVWQQLRWSIGIMGLADDFECKKAPLEIIYKKTGQIISFRGCDDPGKIKSLKAPFGYYGLLWFEEMNQLDGPNMLRNIEQSILRGGNRTYEFCSYNPPRSKSDWVNELELVEDEKRIYHESNYKNVPKDWLGQRFFESAETLRKNNPEVYENEFNGVINGSGGNVFDNVIAQKITDEQIKTSLICKLYAGVDFGNYPDPWHLVVASYDKATGTIYIFGEHRCVKTSNAETGAWILSHYGDALKDAPWGVVCDSAEPKSITDYQMMGIYNALPAKKGSGSVDFGIKWLQWKKIVIDPERCPFTYKELIQYEYNRDKDGNIVGGYPDKDNHAIDALRYAFCLEYMTEMPTNGKYYQDNQRYD